MTSRLTIATAALAILAATSLGFAANAHQSSAAAASKGVRMVQLERVVVTAKRLPLSTASSL